MKKINTALASAGSGNECPHQDDILKMGVRFKAKCIDQNTFSFTAMGDDMSCASDGITKTIGTNVCQLIRWQNGQQLDTYYLKFYISPANNASNQIIDDYDYANEKPQEIESDPRLAAMSIGLFCCCYICCFSCFVFIAWKHYKRQQPASNPQAESTTIQIVQPPPGAAAAANTTSQQLNTSSLGNQNMTQMSQQPMINPQLQQYPMMGPYGQPITGDGSAMPAQQQQFAYQQQQPQFGGGNSSLYPQFAGAGPQLHGQQAQMMAQGGMPPQQQPMSQYQQVPTQSPQKQQQQLQPQSSVQQLGDINVQMMQQYPQLPTNPNQN